MAGYVFADRNTGRIKKQIVYDREDNFWARAFISSKLVGINRERKLVIASLTKEKKLKLSSGNTIQYAEVKNYIEGEKIPQEEEQRRYSFGVYKNNVYLLTIAGYYRVNLKKAVCEKIASAEELEFIRCSPEILEKEDYDYITIKIMPVTDKKFYAMEYFDHDEANAVYSTLWFCTLK